MQFWLRSVAAPSWDSSRKWRVTLKVSPRHRDNKIITREKLSKLICYIFLISQEQNSPRQELHFWFSNGNTLSPVYVNKYVDVSSELLVSLRVFQLVEPTTSCLDCSDNHFIQNTILLWRHNGRDGVSNHQPHNCLLNRLFGRRSKITSKSRVTGLCAWNSPVTDEFPA